MHYSQENVYNNHVLSVVILRDSVNTTESESEVTQLCLTLYDPMDYSLSGSSIHGIFQARILE